jgi:hypothetical protein
MRVYLIKLLKEQACLIQDSKGVLVNAVGNDRVESELVDARCRRIEPNVDDYRIVFSDQERCNGERRVLFERIVDRCEAGPRPARIGHREIQKIRINPLRVGVAEFLVLFGKPLKVVHSGLKVAERDA